MAYQVIDITNDDQVLLDDGDESGIGEAGDDNGEYLVLGNLRIKMTEAQLERLRYYFQNT